MIFEDIVVVENGFPKYDIGAAVLEDFKRHRDTFTRPECPVCLDLPNGFLVGAICKLKYVATGGPFANAQAVCMGETENYPISNSRVVYLERSDGDTNL